MTNRDLLSQYLADPHRSYDAGVALFGKLATKKQKEDYEAFFAKVSGSVATFDPHFTQLVNELVRIERGMVIDPHLYPAAEEEVVEVIDKAAELLNEKSTRIGECEAELQRLREEMVVLMEDQNDEHNARAMEVDELINQHEEEIAKLRKDVDELSKPGVKVVSEDTMPKTIRQKYARIREIAPRYAELHAALTVEGQTDDERKKIANELCDLDDERRKLWQEIDAWAEGKGFLNVDEERPQYSDNAVVRGYEYARAITRLKQNILNSQKSAAKAEKDGRQVVYNNAMRRIAEYEAELARIEAEMKEHEKESEGEPAEVAQ